ncbi:MAG TPA: hypothetical protein VE360_08115 [Pyrinomonadaceae bacterium]|jgi:hypothetical protein|nr:hypothetical protein [Pyrinomonadaceae bacterium]
MRKTRLQVSALMLALAAVGAVSWAARAEADAPAAADAATLEEIANYKSWTRVTEKPVPGGNFFAGG